MTRDGQERPDLQVHWDQRYASAQPDTVSWFQSRPSMSLELIELAGVSRSAAVLDVGGGTSRLVDSLVKDGWADIVVLDISEEALKLSRDRLGVAPGVRWVCADLLRWTPPDIFALWHDRAVFHFLVHEADRRRYREVLSRAVAPGGVVVIATFAPDGPTHCSGLPVARYDGPGLAEALGASFEVLAERREEHLTPTGALQPFTWLALRRT